MNLYLLDLYIYLSFLFAHWWMSARPMPPETDLTCWRLKCKNGRQNWYYVPEGEECDREQSAIEAYYAGLDMSKFSPDSRKCRTAEEALLKGVKFLSCLQDEGGHWPGECSGVLTFTPAILFACYVAKVSMPDAVKKELKRYICSVQLPDGGWGCQLKEPSSISGTTFNYIAMRMLGVGPDHPDLVRARICLQKKGGAVGMVFYCKIWLCVLNLYSWEGLNALLPELWILPTWIPGHPTWHWCYTRHVYLLLTYCYANRITVGEDELIRSLRQELYVEDFYSLKWPTLKNYVTETDIYSSNSWIMTAVHGLFNFYEKYHFSSLRKKAIAEMYEHVKADDTFTNSISFSLFSKSFQMLIRWYVEGSNSPALQEHVSRIHDYFWLGKDGMLSQTLGPQTWDMTWILQSLLEAGVHNNPEYESCLKKAYNFLKSMQKRENLPNYQRYYRQMTKGGFPFGSGENGWVISDGTGEAIKTLVWMEEECPFLEEHMEPQQYFDAVNMIFSLRNPDGGVAAFEATHTHSQWSFRYLRDMFGTYITDASCVECTSSIMQGLKLFQKRFPDHRAAEVSETINKGLQFCRSTQREDGSWCGLWGLCFTYGTWFGLEAFACLGYTYHGRVACKEVTKACEFLVSKQMEDGGWGEEFESYVLKKYIQHTVSQVHQTAWALLGLMAVGYPDVCVLERGIKVLMKKQTVIGDWPRPDVVAGFLKSGGIVYSSFVNVFPTYALARFVRLHPSSPVARQILDGESGLSEHVENGRC